MALCSAVHRLKGAAANLGATGVARVCSDLEDAAREERLDVPALVFELETEVGRAAAAFRHAEALEAARSVPPLAEENRPRIPPNSRP